MKSLLFSLCCIFLADINNSYGQISIDVNQSTNNVVYPGVKNHIEVHGLQELYNPTLYSTFSTLEKINDSSFSLIPGSNSTCKLVVKSMTKSPYAFILKVKPLPIPVIYLSETQAGTTYTAQDFINLDKLHYKFKNDIPQFPVFIDSFSIERLSVDKNKLSTYMNIGSDFNQRTKELIKLAAKGDVYNFSKIYYTISDKHFISSNKNKIRIK